MCSLSKALIGKLQEITTAESSRLPGWIDSKFVANCVIPPLMDENKVHCNIAVVAPVSAGKSTLFNALCGYPILPTAATTTSAVPTYINRVLSTSQESVTVYSLEKKFNLEDDPSNHCFVRNEDSRRTYTAKDISKEMFDELFDYMYFATHRNNEYHQYKTSIENLAYFMKDVTQSDILFLGTDADKDTILKEHFDLRWEVSRHRFLLLMILLCVYVDQNMPEKDMDAYTKELNERRNSLLKKYGFPVNSNYCVCLNWCSDDIPEHTTLTDLPGTGAATNDTETMSSHTHIVRKILSDADAIWVLCSDNGVVDLDLTVALQDVIGGGARKNKVCLYNCKNSQPNNSGPVVDFLKKLPSLTGERCYVVNALAGEYKYTQNGINALMTKTAALKRCNDDEEPEASTLLRNLESLFRGEKKAYCSFTTRTDTTGHINAVQDATVKYTLEDFFRVVLAEYIERLRYEVALTQTIEQAKFYIYIRDSLASTKSILESVHGKGAMIADSVTKALEAAKKQTFDEYVAQMVQQQQDLAKKLESLCADMDKKINAQFHSDLNALIRDVRTEWTNLENPKSTNCLETNLFGNYPLRSSHNNWHKFINVRTAAQEKITMDAFTKALSIADQELQKYQDLLCDYTKALKSVTHDFKTNYINTFVTVFDQKRNEICGDNNQVTDAVYQKFDSTRNKLQQALETQLDALCTKVCNSFNILTQKNGIFDTLRKETDQTFRNRFQSAVLDDLRAFLHQQFMDTNYIGFFLDHLKPSDLHELLNNNFPVKTGELEAKLSKLISTIYGTNVDAANFPSRLSAKVNTFNAEQITGGAQPEIEKVHDNMRSLIGFGAGDAVDMSEILQRVNNAIAIWAGIGEQYKEVNQLIEDHDAENTHRLYEDCCQQLQPIISTSSKKMRLTDELHHNLD